VDEKNSFVPVVDEKNSLVPVVGEKNNSNLCHLMLQFMSPYASTYALGIQIKMSF
jgi:hypothetical protein